jgi:hypothetical protein
MWNSLCQLWTYDLHTILIDVDRCCAADTLVVSDGSFQTRDGRNDDTVNS